MGVIVPTYVQYSEGISESGRLTRYSLRDELEQLFLIEREHGECFPIAISGIGCSLKHEAREWSLRQATAIANV